MTQPQTDNVKRYKLLAVTAWIALALLVTTGLAAVAIKKALDKAAQTQGDDSALPILFDAPAFSLTNQNNQPVSNTAYLGKPWVAAFIYTNCTSACPMVSGRMSALQDKVGSTGVKMVSFTVDPVRDTPDVLRAYAEKFNADLTKWSFLTGTPAQMRAIEEAFHVRIPDDKIAEMNKGATQPVTANELHSDQFMLIDAKGRVRGVYDSKDDLRMTTLQQDAARLSAGAVN